MSLSLIPFLLPFKEGKGIIKSICLMAGPTLKHDRTAVKQESICQLIGLFSTSDFSGEVQLTWVSTWLYWLVLKFYEHKNIQLLNFNAVILQLVNYIVFHSSKSTLSFSLFTTKI